MRNYIQPGNSLDLTAPAGGLKSGQAVVIGALFGIAAKDATEGAKVTLAVDGVFTLPKATGSSLGEGQKAYWTGTEVSGTATGNTLIGHVVEAADTAATETKVRLSN